MKVPCCCRVVRIGKALQLHHLGNHFCVIMVDARVPDIQHRCGYFDAVQWRMLNYTESIVAKPIDQIIRNRSCDTFSIDSVSWFIPVFMCNASSTVAVGSASALAGNTRSDVLK